MNFLINDISNLSIFTSFLNEIEKKTLPILVTGLTDVSKLQLIMGTKELLNRPVCIITYNEIQARKIINDLKYFENNISLFPKREIVTYDFVAESKDLPYERIEALSSIQNGKTKVVVTTVEALMQSMVSKDVLYKNILELKVRKRIFFGRIKRKTCRTWI